jgi:hypothetical protein
VTFATGIVLVVLGAAFVYWGAYRLRRPRREADRQWIRANPLSNLMLGGRPLGFDRMGALVSVVVGVGVIVLGIAALVASSA